MKHGPVILIEDDADDKDVFQDILKDLNPLLLASGRVLDLRPPRGAWAHGSAAA